MTQQHEIEYEKTVSNLYQEYEKEVYKYIRDNIPDDTDILELGCGGCFLLEQLNKDYFVIGIDNNYDLVEIGRSKDLLVYKGDIEKDLITYRGGRGCYDIIIILQVLEHLEKPIKVLRDCKKILKQHGKIIISVPNVHFLTRILNTSLYIDEFNSGHINAYDRTQLKVILEKYCGYEIEKMFFSGDIFPNMKGLGKVLNKVFLKLRLFKRFSRRITCIIKTRN